MKLYVVECESKNCCETVRYSYTLREAAEDALRYYQSMTIRDQNNCEMWIYGYSVEDEIIGKDEKETYFKMLEIDQEEYSCLRDADDVFRLNHIYAKHHHSNISLADDFGNVFDFQLSRDALPDDVYDAIDFLYDEISNNLIADGDTVRRTREIIDIEDIVESKYD